MLKLTISGRQVDTRGIRLSLNLNSSFPFDPTSTRIEGSYAFSLKLPATQNNKEIFSYPHRIEKQGDLSAEFEGELSFNGRVWFRVLVSVTGAGDQTLSCNVKIGSGYYGSLIKDLTLKDIDWDPVSLGTTTQDVIDHADDIVEKSYPDADYTFPMIYCPRFYEDEEGEERQVAPLYNDFINEYSHGFGFQANYYDNTGIYNKYTLVPMPYLLAVLKRCFTYFDYKASGSFFLDTEISKLIVYNNYSLDEIIKRYYVRAQVTASQYFTPSGGVLFGDDSTGDNEDEDGCFDVATGEYTIQEEGLHRVYCELTMRHLTAAAGDEGFYHLRVFFDGAQVEVTLDSVFNTDPFTVTVEHSAYYSAAQVGKKFTIQVLFQNEFEPNPEGSVTAGYLTVNNISKSSVNIYKKEIDLANHLPEITIANFLKSCEKLGAVFGFDHRKKQVEVSMVTDILQQLIKQEYSSTAVKSTRQVGFGEFTGFTLKYDWSSKDEYTQENFNDYVSDNYIGAYDTYDDLPVPDGSNKVALISSLNQLYIYLPDDEGTLSWQFMSDNFYDKLIGDGYTEILYDFTPLTMYLGTSDYVYPKISQRGSSPAFGVGVNEFDFHLLIYHGLQPNYPLASSTKYDYQGNAIGSLELTLASIHSNFLQVYYQWLLTRARPFDIEVYLSATQLKDIDLLEKVRIFNANFLMKSLRARLRDEFLEVSQVSCVKL